MKVADLPLDSPSHEVGVVIDYIYCPTPEGVHARGTVLLIHGFPQTNYHFRRVITPIAKRGYNVLAPNYRGAGGSSKPWNGYIKKKMATDLHTLVEKLGVKGKVHLVGHDIGGMIAHAYAMQFSQDTASIVWGECPLPGSPLYDTLKHSGMAWHFSFHKVPDLPEALVHGKERLYLKHFYDHHAQNPDAISAHDLGVYENAFSAPGAFRAGFNIYRAFEQDAVDNKRFVAEKGRCPVPCLTHWGDKSFADKDAALSMAEPSYSYCKFQAIAGSGHYIAEEKPGDFVTAVVRWLDEQGEKEEDA